MRLNERLKLTFADVHVLDSEAFAQLQDQLSVHIDEMRKSCVFLLALHFGFDIDLDWSAVNRKFERKKDRHLLVL